jgi:hypothetical protein
MQDVGFTSGYDGEANIEVLNSQGVQVFRKYQFAMLPNVSDFHQSHLLTRQALSTLMPYYLPSAFSQRAPPSVK